MTYSETAKTLIAESLAGFLLPDKAPPERIDITVSYAQSSARICLDAERLEKILNNIKEAKS